VRHDVCGVRLRTRSFLRLKTWGEKVGWWLVIMSNNMKGTSYHHHQLLSFNCCNSTYISTMAILSGVHMYQQ
jgi:hypothetical protein